MVLETSQEISPVLFEVAFPLLLDRISGDGKRKGYLSCGRMEHVRAASTSYSDGDDGLACHSWDLVR
jgi:hypothetical protein